MTVAYLFPGQGSHSVGMGQQLYNSHAAAREIFDMADDFLGYKISTICFEGPQDTLTATEFQQPALYTTSLAHWAVIQAEKWPRAAYVAGHSLGEYSALAAAGSLSFFAGLHLVRERGRLMKAAGEQQPGGMAAILALDVKTVAQTCATVSAETNQLVQIANDNCPGQVVISGEDGALALAMQQLKTAGARKVTRLPISIGSHSPLMASMGEDFGRILDDTPINTPEIPVISNLTALPLPAPRRIREELRKQLTQRVRWTESMQTLGQRGVNTFVDVGPGKVLTQLMKRIDRKSTRKTFKPDTITFEN